MEQANTKHIPKLEMDQGNATISNAELLHASIELGYHVFSYVKSMAVGCAVNLGIPEAIHRRGGGASLDDLLAELSLPPSKLTHLRRLMRVLTASGVFAEEKSASTYRLTPVSSLLVDDGDRANLAPVVRFCLSPFNVVPVRNMAEWFRSDSKEAETAFEMEHGAEIWRVCSRDAEFGAFFNDGMAADSRFLMDMVIREAGQVFDGITSLVDVGGGTGTAARAVAAAFPHVKCSVLDLPQVIDSVQADGTVEFIAGNMMDFIPRADALLLKWVLHDWSEQDCVKILKRCKEAIPCKEKGGKVIIIDIVMGASPQAMCKEVQLMMDLGMMAITTGMERDEMEWCEIFKEAGFSEYKIRPIMGYRSIIEVFP